MRSVICIPFPFLCATMAAVHKYVDEPTAEVGEKCSVEGWKYCDTEFSNVVCIHMYQPRT